MIIKKKFNNNVLMTDDKDGKEVVLIGNGLAFNAHPGDKVDTSKVEKVFHIESGNNTESFADFVSKIPEWELNMVEEIVNYGEQILGIKLNKYLYLSLSDHIENAIERNRSGTNLTNPLLWEIKELYPKEFAVAKQALKIIFKYTDVELPEDEAGFIALHFVNTQQKKEKMSQTMSIPKIVRDILSIVEHHFGIKLDKKSTSYERFLVHLKFFAHRVVDNEGFPEAQIKMVNQLAQSWPDIYECVEKIDQYMQDKHQIKINDDERLYLMLHINRVIKK
ncbi:transcriptional antiterminator, BglG family [Lactobacillus apis]|uniref:BglG family transcription antiterminator LicT n=1 Tax=Lactobacillus apis TaxID=303541 RepID=UPI000815A794|nr:PRD domain-containing protein [Lactobacillus apis]GGG36463.1 transcription antiterminator LicT [Lactobacillus apis]SCB90113.1 transcriptional antiterminator, BglG family [Lactobacillus apis]